MIPEGADNFLAADEPFWTDIDQKFVEEGWLEVFLSEGHDPVEVTAEEEDISNNISGRKCNILYPEGPEFFQSSRISDSRTTC